MNNLTAKRIILFKFSVMKDIILSKCFCLLFYFLNSGYEEQKLALLREVTLLAHHFLTN